MKTKRVLVDSVPPHMLAPANGFYSSPRKGVNEVRIAYVLKQEDLHDALIVLDAALKKYKG